MSGLVELAFAGALEDAGHLGQRGHRGGLLVAGELAPPGAVPRLAGELSDEDPVSLRAIIDYDFYSAG